MTVTARTVEIVDNEPRDTAAAIQYFVDLPASDRALFDGVSDFLMAANTSH